MTLNKYRKVTINKCREVVIFVANLLEVLQVSRRYTTMSNVDLPQVSQLFSLTSLSFFLPMLKTSSEYTNILTVSTTASELYSSYF